MSIYSLLYRCTRGIMSVAPLKTRRVRVALLCDNKILLVKNRLGSDDWTLPGGGLKKSERPATAAQREILEELNIEIEKTQLRRISTEKKKFGLYEESYVIYKTPITSLRYKPNRAEIRESRWFELDATPRARSNLVDIALKST